jgi:polysaccharide pyruvyl transferase WcaK-like protein
MDDNQPTRSKESLNILILEDRFALKDTMVNLGDRAYHVGLHELLENQLGHRVTAGPVKAFPFLSSRRTSRLRNTDDVEQLFEHWKTIVLRRSRRKSSNQHGLKRRFENNMLTRSRIFQRLDGKVRDRLARGTLETVSPYLFRNWFASEVRRLISESDLVLFNGGAFVADHLDKYLPMALFELYLAKSMGKRVAVINQTVSIKKAPNKALISYLYPRLDGHIVREPRSKQELEELGTPSNLIHVSCDAAFALTFPEINEDIRRNDLRSVGICVRGDRPVHSAYWAKIAKHLSEDLNLYPRFFFTSKYQDKKAFDSIRAINQHITHDEFCDYPQLLREIQKFEFIITDRYHATVFAVLAATPFITIDSNTFKTRGLMDLFDYPIEVMENDTDFESMRQKITQVRANRENLSQLLLKARSQMASLARSSYDSFIRN